MLLYINSNFVWLFIYFITRISAQFLWYHVFVYTWSYYQYTYLSFLHNTPEEQQGLPKDNIQKRFKIKETNLLYLELKMKKKKWIPWGNRLNLYTKKKKTTNKIREMDLKTKKKFNWIMYVFHSFIQFLNGV